MPCNLAFVHKGSNFVKVAMAKSSDEKCCCYVHNNSLGVKFLRQSMYGYNNEFK